MDSGVQKAINNKILSKENIKRAAKINAAGISNA
jgi:hypothetical protein